MTVMPCYDKKLEASRSDFYNEVYRTRDVDCVITTGELELLMKERGWDLALPVPGEEDPLSDASLPELVSHPGTSSGSYLQSIVDHLQRTSDVPLQLSTRAMRNAGHEELFLTNPEGDILFKGAKCYGFQNLQNVVRKVGRETGIRTTLGAAGRLPGRSAVGLAARKGKRTTGSSDRGYDYVEVMACPGGCVNGGGQLRPPTSTAATTDTTTVLADGLSDLASRPPDPIQAKWGTKEWTRKVEEAYWLDSQDHDPTTTPLYSNSSQVAVLVDQLSKGIINDICLSDEGLGDFDIVDDQMVACRQSLFRTQYRAVESEINGLAVKW